jgi:hypothetical protein
LVHNLEVLSVLVTDRSGLGAEVLMGLAVVRSLDAPRRLDTTQAREDYEQELVDQFLLAAVGAGACDSTVLESRSVIFEFARFLGRPLWMAQPQDADAFLARQRTVLGRAKLTVQHKAWALARFYDFPGTALSGRRAAADRPCGHPGNRRVQPAGQGRLRGAADSALG